jgi:hypothetical protein
VRVDRDELDLAASGDIDEPARGIVVAVADVAPHRHVGDFMRALLR